MSNNSLEKKVAKRKRSSYLLSILGLAFVLYILGLFGMLFLQGKNLVEGLSEDLRMYLVLEESYSDDELASLKKVVEIGLFYKPLSYQYLSKENIKEGLEAEESAQINWEVLGNQNPFQDEVSFELQDDYLKLDSFRNIANQLQEERIVARVEYPESDLDQIVENVNVIFGVGGFLILLFTFIAIVLIHNTIRLDMYANRFIIKNMELVGATSKFIQAPYLKKSIMNGFFSAIIAIVLLLLTFFKLLQSLDLDFLSLKTSHLLFLIIFILVFGVVIVYISTRFTVKKFLNMQLDELY